MDRDSLIDKFYNIKEKLHKEINRLDSFLCVICDDDQFEEEKDIEAYLNAKKEIHQLTKELLEIKKDIPRMNYKVDEE